MGRETTWDAYVHIPTTEIVHDFRYFLNVAWAGLPAWIIKNEINDWLQANWEILVEAKLNEPFCKMEINSERIILDFYGDGADCNGGSSRVWLPDALPTHRIVCKIKSGSVKDIFTGKEIKENEISKMDFLKITTLADNKQWFDDRPPFDCILLSQPVSIENVLVSLNTIDFHVEKIN